MNATGCKASGGFSSKLRGKVALIEWCRRKTFGYSDVNVCNMTSSWRDGLALCALLHRYRPDLIDFSDLSKDQPMENNELAFRVAEQYFDIPRLLDPSDVVNDDNPDELSMMTYVSSVYRNLKDRKPVSRPRGLFEILSEMDATRVVKAKVTSTC